MSYAKLTKVIIRNGPFRSAIGLDSENLRQIILDCVHSEDLDTLLVLGENVLPYTDQTIHTTLLESLQKMHAKKPFSFFTLHNILVTDEYGEQVCEWAEHTAVTMLREVNEEHCPAWVPVFVFAAKNMVFYGDVIVQECDELLKRLGIE